MCLPIAMQAQLRNIKNDSFWNTADGQPIYSQGGGIFRFKDPATGRLRYYWYGVRYAEASRYREDPSVTQPKSTFEAVTCYSSDNLADWKFEANVLDQTALNKGRPTWTARLGVAFISSLHLYAMFIQHGRYVLVTVADSPVRSQKTRFVKHVHNPRLRLSSQAYYLKACKAP